MKLLLSSIIAFVALSLGLVSSTVTCANTNMHYQAAPTENAISRVKDKNILNKNKYKKNIMSKHLIKLESNNTASTQPVDHYSFFEQITFMTDNLQSWFTSLNHHDTTELPENLIKNHAMCS